MHGSLQRRGADLSFRPGTGVRGRKGYGRAEVGSILPVAVKTGGHRRAARFVSKNVLTRKEVVAIM